MKAKTQWVNFKEIKQRIGMEDILEHYWLLKNLKKKEDELVGYCPIHDEKHYSKNAFCVNISKNIWHCLARGISGNFLDFVAPIGGSLCFFS